MRLILTSLLFFTGLQTALAHTLGGDASLAEQLTHQVIGVHHIPLLVLVVAAAFVLFRRLLGNRSD